MVSSRERKKEKTTAERRERRTYSEGHKKQLVELFNHGNPHGEIIREYDLTGSAFVKWAKRISSTGSGRDRDNRTPGEQELLGPRKENQQPQGTQGCLSPVEFKKTYAS